MSLVQKTYQVQSLLGDIVNCPAKFLSVCSLQLLPSECVDKFNYESNK